MAAIGTHVRQVRPQSELAADSHLHLGMPQSVSVKMKRMRGRKLKCEKAGEHWLSGVFLVFLAGVGWFD